MINLPLNKFPPPSVYNRFSIFRYLTNHIKQFKLKNLFPEGIFNQFQYKPLRFLISENFSLFSFLLFSSLFSGRGRPPLRKYCDFISVLLP